MKKYIVPIVITIIVFAFMLFYMVGFWFLPQGSMVVTGIKIAGTGIMLFALVTLIKVLLQRIKEIKEEDEDDLGKY